MCLGLLRSRWTIRSMILVCTGGGTKSGTIRRPDGIVLVGRVGEMRWRYCTWEKGVMEDWHVPFHRHTPVIHADMSDSFLDLARRYVPYCLETRLGGRQPGIVDPWICQGLLRTQPREALPRSPHLIARLLMGIQIPE